MGDTNPARRVGPCVSIKPTTDERRRPWPTGTRMLCLGKCETSWNRNQSCSSYMFPDGGVCDHYDMNFVPVGTASDGQ